MKTLKPQKPAHLSPYAQTCLEALSQNSLAQHISLGGALGLFHYIDYRATHDVDAWWSESVTQEQRQQVLRVLQKALTPAGHVRARAWGDVDSIELQQAGKTIFSFQIARRSVQLEDSVSAGWLDVPLDSLADLVASKMVALVERGAPRDFLDIYTICKTGILNIPDCWALWHKRETLAGSDADKARACLAIETHLERIALHRPLEKIEDARQREEAQTVRAWFSEQFCGGKDD